MIDRQALAKAILKKKGLGQSALEVRDLSFPEQDKFVMDYSRLCCAQTTVRAGKTSGLSIKYFRAGLKYKRVMLPYIALTRDSAKNIMWSVLQDMADKFKIDCEFTESDLTCYIKKTGSSIKLFGADMKNFMVRLKGIKTPLAAVDEAQDFRSHIEDLIESVLIARTSEYEDGQVVVTGTPGPAPRGYFFEASRGLRGFSTHKWSLFNNPYFPTAQAFVEKLKLDKAWPDDFPTLRREYYGEWVYDQEALVLHYNEAINSYLNLPEMTDYVISVDIGHDDADAIAVIGWHKHKKAAYLVEEFIKAGQGITELADKIEELNKAYSPRKIVMDTGGLGKKIAVELRRRRELPIVAAEKTRKVEYLALLDDALRTREFFARGTSQFAKDSYVVEWDLDKSTSDKLVIKDEPHSDIVDAVLYGFREALHWMPEEKTELVPIRNAEAYLKHTEKLMEEQLEREIQIQREEEAHGDLWALHDAESDQEFYRHFINKRRA